MYFTSTIITLLHILWVPFFIGVYLVLFLFDSVICVFLLLWLCILIVCLCLTTLTEVFPCFFLSCKANARVKPALRRGTARTLPNFCVVLCIVCFVSFSVLFVCICVLNYCHRVTTQLQLHIYHNFLRLCDHNSSYKHVSAFEWLPSYDRLNLGIEGKKIWNKVINTLPDKPNV